MPLWSCERRTTSQPSLRNVVLITIDTLRADHVGAYGYARARTPTLDALARGGMRFDRAYAAAPITLPSHATLLTGLYPPRHGARDNGMAMSAVPTLATELKARGFSTAAFVAAFPLDHQFGLSRGFDVYSDRLGRDATGKPANERPASQVVDDAIAWVRTSNGRFFLWVHMFEPHAPYGNPADRRPAADRYDEEIAIADREAGRLLDALPNRAETLVVAAGDHGEAFGEHGEYAHSIFIYDTTLRVPLIVHGPPLSGVVSEAVTLADVAPTVAHLLGVPYPASDGIDVSPAFAGTKLPSRELYAESFAPFVEFGWAPLRALRSGAWKYIAAPKPELFDLDRDPSEQSNVVAAHGDAAGPLERRVNNVSAASLTASGSVDAAAAARLRALGYLAQSASPNPPSALSRPDPKDRRELAARIAQVTSGELEGPPLIAALEGIVRDDPRNGQAYVRLGYARLQSGDCERAEPAFRAAAATGLPSADTYLGLATCLGRRSDLRGAEQALTEAQRLEPDNPVVTANLGILRAAKGELRGAIDTLKQALSMDPDLHLARFNLAIAYAKTGHISEARTEARALLAQLPPNATERPDLERLLRELK